MSRPHPVSPPRTTDATVEGYVDRAPGESDGELNSSRASTWRRWPLAEHRRRVSE